LLARTYKRSELARRLLVFLRNGNQPFDNTTFILQDLGNGMSSVDPDRSTRFAVVVRRSAGKLSAVGLGRLVMS
jgi:hypothetical protein